MLRFVIKIVIVIVIYKYIYIYVFILFLYMKFQFWNIINNFQSHILAAKSIASILSTSLGPKVLISLLNLIIVINNWLHKYTLYEYCCRFYIFELLFSIIL